MSAQERREQVLDAVLSVIADRGVDKVSMDSVARVAGVARPVLYRHFADTDALLRASLDREEARATAAYFAAIPPPGEPAAVTERWTQFYANVLEMFQASPDLWRAILVLADSTTSTFRRRMERGREMAAQSLVELLQPLPAGADIELVARLLLATLLESGRLLLTDPENYPRERLLRSGAPALARLLSLGEDHLWP